MSYLSKYKDYIITEHSKNNPIPEINKMKEKLGIVLLGLPGSGKSTFAKNFIATHNQNIKKFSTDDVSYLFTKDKSKFHVGSSELNISSLKYYMKSGQNFIYDTTGSNDINIFEVTKDARNNGYKIMFILILIDVDTAKSQNKKRAITGGHLADDEYIDNVYSNQLQTTKSYLKYIKPDSFYVVLNKDGNYKYYKFDNGELKKRKVDKYVSFMKESNNSENEVDKIVDTMLDFIDEGVKIIFKSSTGDMSYTDYLEKNTKYQNFKPVIVSKNKKVSRFKIFYFLNGTYDNLIIALDNMKSTIGRLGDEGWVLSDFKSESNRGVDYGKEVSISLLSFEFSKPDLDTDSDNFELPDESELRTEIEKSGIGITNLDIEDSGVSLDFYSHSYDGDLSSENFYDEKFEEICDIFGFSGYDLDYQNAKVYFEY
jgi:predicted ABC-type ATPase